MLMIRLQRFGRKHDPNFRVVLTEKQNGPKSGKFGEILGFYNPRTKTKKIERERVEYWMSRGAQLSDTVHNMLVAEKIIEGEKINVVPPPKPTEIAEAAAFQVDEGKKQEAEQENPETEKRPEELKKEEAEEKKDGVDSN